jgi:hypothetical protein
MLHRNNDTIIPRYYRRAKFTFCPPHGAPLLVSPHYYLHCWHTLRRGRRHFHPSACVHVCMCACVSARARVCVCVFVCSCDSTPPPDCCACVRATASKSCRGRVHVCVRATAGVGWWARRTAVGIDTATRWCCPVAVLVRCGP